MSLSKQGGSRVDCDNSLCIESVELVYKERRGSAYIGMSLDGAPASREKSTRDDLLLLRHTPE